MIEMYNLIRNYPKECKSGNKYYTNLVSRSSLSQNEEM